MGVGCKMSWLVLPSLHPKEEARALTLSSLREETGWKGVEAVDVTLDGREGVVRPSVDGWTLVLGSWVASDGQEALAEALRHRLSKPGASEPTVSLSPTPGRSLETGASSACSASLMGRKS